MAYILVRHNVADFAKWYPLYTAHASARKEMGSQGAQLFRNPADPTEVTLLMKWSSMDDAQAFARSDSLRSAMQNAGVVGKPDISFLEEEERTPA